MKELTQQEVLQVSGAGIIQDSLSSIGGFVGNSLYGIISNMGVDIPVLGSVTLGSILPDLGKSIGSALGSTAGGTIESVIASLPLVGSWLNGLLGN